MFHIFSWTCFYSLIFHPIVSIKKPRCLSVVATKYAQCLQNPIIFLKSPFFFSNSLSNPRNILRKSAFIQQRSQQQYHLIYHHYSVHYNGSAILRGSPSAWMHPTFCKQPAALTRKKENIMFYCERKPKTPSFLLFPFQPPTCSWEIQSTCRLYVQSFSQVVASSYRPPSPTPTSFNIFRNIYDIMKTDDASSSIALFYVFIHTATKLFTPMKPTSTSSALFQHNKLATTRRRLNRLLCHSDCESVSAQENATFWYPMNVSNNCECAPSLLLPF